MFLLKETFWEKAAVAVLLILAIAPMPYGYYVFLKITTCLAAIREVREATPIILGRPLPILWIIIAILFNPVIPIPLRKESWVIVDGITAAIFAWGAFLPNFQKTRGKS